MPMYPEIMVLPMREELAHLGIKELRTAEEVDGALKALTGVDGVGGNSTTAKVTYWPAEVTEDAIRKQFADSGFPVK